MKYYVPVYQNVESATTVRGYDDLTFSQIGDDFHHRIFDEVAEKAYYDICEDTFRICFIDKDGVEKEFFVEIETELSVSMELRESSR